MKELNANVDEKFSCFFELFCLQLKKSRGNGDSDLKFYLKGTNFYGN